MMVITLIYIAFVVFVMTAVAIVGFDFLGTLEDAPLPKEHPRVTTIVPARNEERNIGRCATGLTQQSYSNLEMVFVDDASEDDTGAILDTFAAQDERVKVINTGGKPDEWNGKQWACYSGAQAATGDWLCFMDADTFAEPNCIERTLAFATHKGIDMLTLQPWYELRGLWERIVLPQGLAPIMLVFPPKQVNNPNHPLSMANGQFILIRREVYEATGGHAAVKNHMMDDFSLARIIKGAGYRLFIAEGFDVMRVRLYTNLEEIWAGSLKAAVELTGGWLKTTLGLLGNIIVNILPVVLFALALMLGYTREAALLGGLIVYQVVYYGISRMVGFRAPPWTAVLYPIGAILTSILLIDGMIRVATGGPITWKGRDVQGRPELR